MLLCYKVEQAHLARKLMAMILKNNTSNQEFLKNLEMLRAMENTVNSKKFMIVHIQKGLRFRHAPFFFHYNYRKYTLLELLLFPNNQEGIGEF